MNLDATFKPGFRLSLFDLVVLIAEMIRAFVVGAQVWWAGLVIGFVVGHFFLFCNVFRIARKPELIWAAVFTVPTGSTVLTGMPGWIATFALSFLVAVVLIYLETNKPDYHGIGWQSINPGLREWWETERESH